MFTVRTCAPCSAPLRVVAARSRACSTPFCDSASIDTRPKLAYFNIAGRAEPLRLLLSEGLGASGWINESFSKGPAWDAFKRSSAPLGSVPVLHWPSRQDPKRNSGAVVEVAQTLAIAQFLGARLGLQGEGDADQALCATLATAAYTELLVPLSNLLWAPVRLRGIPLGAVAYAYCAKMVELMPLIEARMAASCGPFVLGTAPCVADFFLAEWAGRHRECFGEGQPELRLPPRLRELALAVAERPGLREYAAAARPTYALLDEGGAPGGPLRWTNSPAEASVRRYLGGGGEGGACYVHAAAARDPGADARHGRGGF